MTRDEFNKMYGNTFFVKVKKWGHQMTDADAAKAGYTVTSTARTTAKEKVTNPISFKK